MRRVYQRQGQRSSTTELFFARHDDQEQRSRTHDVEPRPAKGSEAQEGDQNGAKLVDDLFLAHASYYTPFIGYVKHCT